MFVAEFGKISIDINGVPACLTNSMRGGSTVFLVTAENLPPFSREIGQQLETFYGRMDYLGPSETL